MGKYIKEFQLQSEFEDFYNTRYRKPGVSYVVENSTTTYNQPPITYEYVDLGLASGTLGATTNIGARNPENYGGYYAWGEVEAKDNYAWSEYKGGGKNERTKYNSTDGKTTLDLEDDVAHVVMGNNGVLPTQDQINELCGLTKTGTTINGIDGILFTGNNNNTLFFPAAGYIENLSSAIGGAVCYIGTNKCHSNIQGHGGLYCMSNNTVRYMYSIPRNIGFPRRGVIASS